MFKLLFFLAFHKVIFGATNKFYQIFPSSKIVISNIKNDSVKIQWNRTEINDFLYELQVRDPKNVTIDLNTKTLPYKNSYTLKNLKAGATYNYRFCKSDLADEHKIYCNDKLEYFTTGPNPPSGFRFVSQNETMIHISWYPPSIPYTFTHYQATIKPSDGNLLMNNNNREALFYNLTPGRLYTITVTTVAIYKTSDTIKINCLLSPIPPADMTIDYLSVTPTSFRVDWKDPKQKLEFDKYEITLCPQLDNVTFSLKCKIISLNPNIHSWTFNNLQSNMAYWAVIQTVSKNKHSQPIDRGIYLEPLLQN